MLCDRRHQIISFSGSRIIITISIIPSSGRTRRRQRRHYRSRYRARSGAAVVVIIGNIRGRFLLGQGRRRQPHTLLVTRLGLAESLLQFLEGPQCGSSRGSSGGLKGPTHTIWRLLALPEIFRHQGAVGQKGVFKAFSFGFGGSFVASGLVRVVVAVVLSQWWW